MYVLGIETSCDETGVAIYAQEKGLLAHEVYSQIKTHALYGGVVPEIASRDHVRKLAPLIQSVLAKAQLTLSDLNGIAYTKGPGLVGALLVGAMLGRSLAYALNIPAIGVHHLEGHLLAVFLEARAPSFPFLTLLVSGGHTELISVDALGKYQVIGDTLDDAVGEAFDKTAKLLGLAYPGGAALAQLAESGRSKHYHFPRPMIDKPGLDFSFSGLKTHAWQTLAKEEVTDQVKADIALAFQDAVVETLTIKCHRALKQTGHQRLVIAGGVGANQALRLSLQQLCNQLRVELYFPRPAFCTDNAAMIAYAGYQHLLLGEREPLEVVVFPRQSL